MVVLESDSILGGIVSLLIGIGASHENEIIQIQKRVGTILRCILPDTDNFQKGIHHRSGDEYAVKTI
jgi:hypothetical protein